MTLFFQKSSRLPASPIEERPIARLIYHGLRDGATLLRSKDAGPARKTAAGMLRNLAHRVRNPGIRNDL